jgi:hypothetical protein
MNIPVKLAIAGLNATDLATKASNIEAAMTDNPTFANPTPTLAELQSARVELETLMASSATGNRSAIAARRAQEGVVANLLRKLAVYVKLTAISEAEVLSAGFDVRSSNTPMRVLTQPTGLKAQRSDTSGKVLASWDAVRGRLHYILEMTTSDPSQSESPWAVVAYTSKVRHTVDNLTPGHTYWFRVTALGTSGSSAKSDPAMVMAA